MEQIIKSYGFTEARNNLTAIIDAVQTNLPQLIKKRKRSEDDVLIIKSSLLRDALSIAGDRRLTMKVTREKDRSWTLILEPFSLAVNAASKEQAIDELVNDMRTYAEEYIEHRAIYLQSPNRKKHLPLVIQILLCSSDAELKELISIA